MEDHFFTPASWPRSHHPRTRRKITRSKLQTSVVRLSFLNEVSLFCQVNWRQNRNLYVLWKTGLRTALKDVFWTVLFVNNNFISCILFSRFVFRWSRIFFALICSWSPSPLPAGEIYHLSTPCGNYWFLMCEEFSPSTLLEEKGWSLLGESRTTHLVLGEEVIMLSVEIPVALWYGYI